WCPKALDNEIANVSDKEWFGVSPVCQLCRQCQPDILFKTSKSFAFSFFAPSPVLKTTTAWKLQKTEEFTQPMLPGLNTLVLSWYRKPFREWLGRGLRADSSLPWVSSGDVSTIPATTSEEGASPSGLQRWVPPRSMYALGVKSEWILCKKDCSSIAGDGATVTEGEKIPALNKARSTTTMREANDEGRRKNQEDSSRRAACSHIAGARNPKPDLYFVCDHSRAELAQPIPCGMSDILCQ
ncbi:hypothetical protein FOZ60_000624, partial [Perkinsus olseni]